MTTRTDPLGFLADEVEALRRDHLYRALKVMSSQQGPEIELDGRHVISLSSNDYLGLTHHPRLRDAALAAVRDFGVGSGAVRTIAGTMSMHEALEALAAKGIFINALRIRAFPFQDEINDFVRSHTKVFVIEQNRDAQMKTLLVNEAGVSAASLIPVLHYDGTPITARFIAGEIEKIVSALNVRPIKQQDKQDKAA